MNAIAASIQQESEDTETTSLAMAVPSQRSIWTGRGLSGLGALFLAFDASVKVLALPLAVEATTKLGYPESSIRPIGAAALAGAILYAIPQTSVLGAILLTGFLGGAIATHVRVSESNWMFALVFGIVTWLGIYFREPRLRSLIPLRQI